MILLNGFQKMSSFAKITKQIQILDMRFFHLKYIKYNILLYFTSFISTLFFIIY